MCVCQYKWLFKWRLYSCETDTDVQYLEIADLLWNYYDWIIMIDQISNPFHILANFPKRRLIEFLYEAVWTERESVIQQAKRDAGAGPAPGLLAEEPLFSLSFENPTASNGLRSSASSVGLELGNSHANTDVLSLADNYWFRVISK